MPKITLIACLDKSFGIGKDGGLLFDFKEDMDNFRKVTEGGTVVMGRGTWDSLPNKPLPNRNNFVMTTNKSLEFDGATPVYSVDEVLSIAKDKEVFIIGGQWIYELFISHANKMILTHVNYTVESDRAFPEFLDNDWNVAHSTNDNRHFTISTYLKV